jgi:hypothetical protein
MNTEGFQVFLFEVYARSQTIYLHYNNVSSQILFITQETSHHFGDSEVFLTYFPFCFRASLRFANFGRRLIALFAIEAHHSIFVGILASNKKVLVEFSRFVFIFFRFRLRKTKEKNWPA